MCTMNLCFGTAVPGTAGLGWAGQWHGLAWQQHLPIGGRKISQFSARHVRALQGEACSITKKELETILREKALKGKAVTDEVKTITDGCVESKVASGSLERVKG